MPKSFQRIKTDYPGVYFIEGTAVGTGKPERIYYIRYRKNGKAVDEKVGRQFQNDMTPARAARIRALKVEGLEIPNAEKRASEQAKKKAENTAKAAEESRWTISKLWDSYCETHIENKVLDAEKQKFNVHLRESVGNKEPAQLLPVDVDRIRLALQKRGHKTTAARILEILRRTINYGVKKGHTSPLTFKIEIPRLNNQTTEDLSERQIKDLLEALDADADQQAANVMRIALFTGMRRSEIFRLKWVDIDSQRGFISIRDPKGGRDQTIPLSAAAAALFERIERYEEAHWVFPGQNKGKHLTTLNRESVDRIRKAAGFPPGFRPLHGLRHVFASMLASSGRVDLYTLQKLLTHKSPAMTQRYAHLRDDVLKRAAEVAGNIISSIGEKDGETENSPDKQTAELNREKADF
jgi:integrase